MPRIMPFTALIAIITLSACDAVDSDLERAVVGAAIGCAAGEALVNGRCVEGAVIGAGVGALTN